MGILTIISVYPNYYLSVRLTWEVIFIKHRYAGQTAAYTEEEIY